MVSPNHHNSAGRQRSGLTRSGRAVLSLVFLAVVASSCSNTQIPTDSVLLAATVPTAAPTPTPTSVPEKPELPPESAEAGQPIADNVATAEALGLIDVCSLYEDADRLSELLGEFWELGPGVAADGQCLWVSSKSSDTSAVVSIELNATAGADDAGSTVISESGAGLSISVDGNMFAVNVVTNELDPTLAILNLEEAERRIADDIYERLTGTDRPTDPSAPDK